MSHQTQPEKCSTWNNPPAPRSQASRRTLQQIATARAMITTITDQLDRDEQTALADAANWGHAGSAAKTANDLEEIARFLTGTAK